MPSNPDTPIGSDYAETCRAISTATTDGEVVAAVRRYLGSLDHHKIALPAQLLSLQVNHAVDIAAASVELARLEATLLLQGPEATVLKNVATVLSTAAMRLAIISLEPSSSSA